MAKTRAKRGKLPLCVKECKNCQQLSTEYKVAMGIYQAKNREQLDIALATILALLSKQTA